MLYFNYITIIMNYLLCIHVTAFVSIKTIIWQSYIRYTVVLSTKMPACDWLKRAWAWTQPQGLRRWVTGGLEAPGAELMSGTRFDLHTDRWGSWSLTSENDGRRVRKFSDGTLITLNVLLVIINHFEGYMWLTLASITLYIVKYCTYVVAN